MRASLPSVSLFMARFLLAHCMVQRKAALDLRMDAFDLFISLFIISAVVWHPRVLAKAVLGIAADTTVKAAVTWYLGQGQSPRFM